MMATQTIEDRFRSKIDKEGPDGCWTWTGAKRNGYGLMNVDGHMKGAHVIAFELFKGNIPDGQEIDHTCQNPSCVNPAHLQAVTHSSNMRMANGNRGVPPLWRKSLVKSKIMQPRTVRMSVAIDYDLWRRVTDEAMKRRYGNRKAQIVTEALERWLKSPREKMQEGGAA